jgi:V8-like Glu-specific endopeptidase
MKLSQFLLFVSVSAAYAGTASAEGTVVRLGPAAPNAMPAESVFIGGKPMRAKAAGRPAATKDRAIGRNKAPAAKTARAMQAKQHAGAAGGPAAAPVQIVPDSAASPAARSTGARNKPTARSAGWSFLPFTLSKVEPNNWSVLNIMSYPVRAVGRLGFTQWGQNWWCTASLIDKGLVVTSAGCVAGFGTGIYPDARWAFIPGYHRGMGAYGTFKYRDVFVPKPYLDGTDECAHYGAACANDVAVIVLQPNRRNQYPGTLTGWLAWTTASDLYLQQSDLVPVAAAQVTQLGYAGNISGGKEMLRSDAPLFLSNQRGQNGVFGSAMIGSGYPLVANFRGINFQEEASTPMLFPGPSDPNTVIGVSGVVMSELNLAQAIDLNNSMATMFNEGNIGALVAAACQAYPDACTQP